jgi:hypothetical protein
MCTICAHPDREEIERDFIDWKSPAKIAAEYKLRDRAAVYRHANALNFHATRSRNIGAALDRIIKQVESVEVTGGTVVQAIALRARINSRGELAEKNERTLANESFAKMSREELLEYAVKDVLPPWFTRSEDSKGQQNSGGTEGA